MSWDNKDEYGVDKGTPPLMTPSEMAGALIIVLLVIWLIFH
jgi:hypothetical protein